MVLDSLLAGVMLFTSFAARTPNVQPNPDDYEVSVGISNDDFYLNRQWERELGSFYIDDLFWLKYDNGLYIKPEYMNKESRDVKYLKLDARRNVKDWSFGITSRSIGDDIINSGFETFVSFGMSKKKTYWEKVEVEGRDTFEFEDKFKVSYQITEKIRIYNLGEISKLQGKEFYKAKIGFEVKL